MPHDRPLSNLVLALGNFPEMIKDTIDRNGNCAVLEIGCGFGLPLLQLKSQFGSRLRIVGINVQKWECQPRRAAMKGLLAGELRWITVARMLIGIEKPIYICADANHPLPFPVESFDYVYSRLAMGFLNEKAGCLEEIHRTLKPDGHAYIDLSLQQVETQGQRDILFFVKTDTGCLPFTEILDHLPSSIRLRTSEYGIEYFELIKESQDHLDLGLKLISCEVRPPKMRMLKFVRSTYQLC